jgi:hypothetical protein
MGKRTLRSLIAEGPRRVVAGATDRRFDAVEAELGRLTARISEMEHLLDRGQSAVDDLRLQVDECLAFLRVQHDIVRDVLEELRPVMESRREPGAKDLDPR